MSRRRELNFVDLKDVMPDVDRLLLAGYTRGGSWSLGQACQHLAMTLNGSLTGLSGHAPWVVRRTLGAFFLGRVLGSGKMPAGIQIKPTWKLMPGADLDDRAEAETLRRAIAAYRAKVGPLAEHPFFGPLTREQWDRLHCIHIAHHLSFLLPAGPDAGQAGRG